MAASVLVDAGFLIALLSRRDTHHRWAVMQAQRLPPPWKTCEAALSEALHLLGGGHQAPLCELLRRRALTVGFDLGDDLESVLKLIEKYAGRAGRTGRRRVGADDGDARRSGHPDDRLRLPPLPAQRPPGCAVRHSSDVVVIPQT